MRDKMNRAEAAKYIKDTYGIPCSAATLAKWACVAGCDGPAYRKFNKRYTIYERADLDEWAARRLGKVKVYVDHIL